MTETLSSKAADAGDPLDFQFHHAGVSVPDLDAAIDWYGRVLGFALERRGRLRMAAVQVAHMRRGALIFELFQPDEGTALPEDRKIPQRDLLTHGNKHVGFSVGNLDAAVARLREHNVEIITQSIPAVFIRDLAGNLIELMQRT